MIRLAGCHTTFQVRTELKWAEVGAVKAEVEQQVAALLGPKTEEDVAAATAPKKKVCLPSRYVLHAVSPRPPCTS
jgi:Glutaminyl-tRNA synthetase, non-specific RNA binding region part 2